MTPKLWIRVNFGQNYSESGGKKDLKYHDLLMQGKKYVMFDEKLNDDQNSNNIHLKTSYV